MSGIVTKNEALRKIEVAELMGHFRDSILSVVPSLQKAGINWNNVGQDENLDTLLESLFDLIVRAKVEFEAENTLKTEINLAKYGFLYRNYAKQSFIEVVPKDADEKGIFALIHIYGREKAYDTCYCAKLDDKFNVVEEGKLFFLNDISFRIHP